MLFNSLSFLLSFAALAAVYYTVPHRARWPLLLVASLGFYSLFDPWLLVPLAAVTLFAYAGGSLIDRAERPALRRGLATAFVLAVLAPLVFFKYREFVIVTIASWSGRAAVETSLETDRLSTFGLSFYTFSAISYLVDVYRRDITSQRHLGKVALYLAFFPKLLAGPIERASPFLAQLSRPVAFDQARIVAGLQQMLWGLFKKVVIADRLAVLVDRAYAQPAFAPTADLVIATHLFAIQLYCDFSGYSDIAIGASRVLGIDLAENFRRPYLSTSVGEFWARRWHLSLASWFRDYVYIPIGGNRVSLARQSLNVMVVFLASGLWHGASWTFVAWGGINGVWQVSSIWWQQLARTTALARSPVRLPIAARRVVTFYLILISWVFFRAASLQDALTIFARVGAALPALPGQLVTRLGMGDYRLALLLVGILLAVELIDERRSIWERLNLAPVRVRWAAYYTLIFALLILGVWHVQQFVYMQF